MKTQLIAMVTAGLMIFTAIAFFTGIIDIFFRHPFISAGALLAGIYTSTLFEEKGEEK